MFFFLLLAVALAEKAFVAPLLLPVGTYRKIVPGDCHYVTKAGSFTTDKDKNLKIYSTVDCTGTEVTGTAKNTSELIIKPLMGEYKDAPKHAGFINDADSANCPNKKTMLRTYYSADCFTTKKTLIGSNVGAKYVEKDDTLKIQYYKDTSCNEKDGEPQAVEGFKKCGTCENGIQYECGTISTMILAIFFVLAFLF